MNGQYQIGRERDRRRKLVRMRVVGVDLGGTNVRVVAADEDSGFLARARERTDAAGGAAVVAQVARLAREVAGGQLAELAVGTAGIVDPTGGRVGVVNNIGGLDRERPRARLHEELGVPVVLENDVNLAALGERARGVARGAGSVAFLAV